MFGKKKQDDEVQIREDEIKYDVDQSFGDFIIEEGPNTSTNLRFISWNDRPHKLDLRKYTFKDGKERPMKGITLSDKGGHELTQVFVQKGYGDTFELVKSLSRRDDFDPAMITSEYQEAKEKEKTEGYYDPSELLGSSDDDE